MDLWGILIRNMEWAPALPSYLIAGVLKAYIYFQIPLKYFPRECVLENIDWPLKKYLAVLIFSQFLTALSSDKL